MISYAKARYWRNKVVKSSLMVYTGSRATNYDEYIPSLGSFHQPNTVPPSLRGSKDQWKQVKNDSLYLTKSGKNIFGGPDWKVNKLVICKKSS